MTSAPTPVAAPTPFRWPVLGYLAVAIVLGVGVYLPILHNFFHMEDFLTLNAVANRPFVDWAIRPQAGHLLIARNFVFEATYFVAGGNPPPYFWGPLFVHLVNVVLLFTVVWSVTASARLACLGATVWAISPVNEGTLGYYTYFCYAMFTTLVLVVLLRMVQRARQPGLVPLREVALWVVYFLDRRAAPWNALRPGSALARVLYPSPEARPAETESPLRLPLACLSER